MKLNPNDVPLHLEFARAMIKLGQVDRAIEQFEAAIGASQGMEKADLRRNDAPVHVEFALALERMKRWPEAKRQYQAALDYSQPLPEGDRREAQPGGAGTDRGEDTRTGRAGRRRNRECGSEKTDHGAGMLQAIGFKAYCTALSRP